MKHMEAAHLGRQVPNKAEGAKISAQDEALSWCWALKVEIQKPEIHVRFLKRNENSRNRHLAFQRLKLCIRALSIYAL